MTPFVIHIHKYFRLLAAGAASQLRESTYFLVLWVIQHSRIIFIISPDITGESTIKARVPPT
jgi:hypothetical protein